MLSENISKRIREQNETVRKMNLEELESEYRTVLEKMIDSHNNYNDLYGYYFSLVVELNSRYISEDTNRSFERAHKYRESLQKKIEED